MRRVAALVCSAVMIAAAVALAQAPAGFSADMQMKSPKSPPINGKFYFSGNKTRMDVRAEGQESRIISDLNAKKVYMVMPEHRMYMEYGFGQMQGQKTPDLKPRNPNNPCDEAEYTCKKVGTETVNGRSCDKWRFTSKKKDTANMTAWLDQKSMVPIRSVTDDGHQWDLLNLKEGPQNPSLFAIPSGYTKMDMGGMMGGQMPRPRR